uniref:HECT domain-containing protein n=1 Tax=Leishmania guyanensis TaxID=5670 RepID=A0A1E1J8T4_LEIGU|nr:hypothetical protein, conserved [Leishmania guyanensis]
MSSLALLSDIRSTFLAAYDTSQSSGDNTLSSVGSIIGRSTTTAATEDARQHLLEHLGLLCTTICISGEEYVRAFPANLYVALLTEILAAVHVSQRGNGCVMNPLTFNVHESNTPSSLGVANQQKNGVAMKRHPKRLSALCMSSLGMQAASPVEVLVLRALALIAEMVPSGSFALCPSRNKGTIATLALYLSDPGFLVVNEDLTEELLKCFRYVSMLAHNACLHARVPAGTVKLLRVLEPHHLRLLCIQVLSNLLSRARESDLEGVWSPVMAKLLESFDGFLLEGSFRLSTPETAHRLATEGFSTEAVLPSVPVTSTAATAATNNAYSTLTAARLLTPKEAAMLQHYMAAIAHAIDRLLVCVASIKAHMKLIHHVIQVCVQLLHLSLHIRPSTYGEWLRTVALSPILTFYLTNPTLAVPILLQMRVWEAICVCMLTLVERREVPPGASSAAVSSASHGTERARHVQTGNTAMHVNSSANTTSAAVPSSTSSAPNTQGGSSGDGSSEAAAATTQANAAQRGSPALATGPVLTTDVTTIPFLADELRLLPLLEFLLVLLPCARRGHSHTDFRNTTFPYFGWAWEDDFHNETECSEALSRRLERVYQQTRNGRKQELFAVTHGKQRIFYIDFLSKLYLSQRRERHCLHRMPLLKGYVHSTQNALLHSCTCCASEPAPLFSTWVNPNHMQIRTADTETDDRHGKSDDNTSGVTAEEEDEEDGSQALGSAPQLTAMARASSSPSLPGSNSRGGGSRTVSLFPSHSQDQRRNLLRTPDVRASDPDGAGGNRDAVTNPSAGPQSKGEPATRTGSRGARIVHPSSRCSSTTYDERNEEDSDKVYYSTMNECHGEPLQRSSRHRGGGLGFLLCRCDCGTTATSRYRNRQVQMKNYLPNATTSPLHRGRSLAVTVLPIEAMLENPGERLQVDPATRKAFLGKGVLSNILSTIVPALLSVLDNCVNPVVARHSVTLLLRCFSLSADLRSQVTGDSIELFKGDDSGKKEAAVTTAASEVSSKRGWRRMSFGRWITGGWGSRPRRWQRAEWEASQAALQRLLPSLRQVLVSLYVTGKVDIVAERQEFFGYMRDDLLMADELARVGLSTEFFGFQLALPSEQHVCTADAIVLLLGLFSSATAAACATPVPSSKVLKKGKKTGSLPRPPRENTSGDKNAGVQLSAFQSISSFGVSVQESVVGRPTPPVPQASHQSQHSQDGRSIVASLTSLGITAVQRGTPLSQGSQIRTIEPSPPQRVGTDSQPQPRSYPAMPSQPSSVAFSQAVNGSCSTGTYTVPDRFPKARTAATTSSRDASDTGVFSLHQSTLLLSYARQIVRRSSKVRAAAQRIHETMNQKVFHTRVLIGASATGNRGIQQLRSRELTLRLFPDSSCPYHSTFVACTETFLRASQAMLVALLAAGVPMPAMTIATAAESEDLMTRPETAAFLPGIDAVSRPPLALRREAAQPTEGVGTAAAVPSQVPLQLKEGEKISVDVELSVIPTTVNAAAMQEAIERAMEDTVGVYRRLPSALRGLLGFYDYCKQNNVELRAAVVETPNILGDIATHLEQWLASRARQREDAECSNASIALSAYISINSLDVSSHCSADALLPIQRRLRLDSTARGKLLSLIADFATTIGRDLGLATLDLAPSVVTKQPCSFEKRAKRFKISDAIRFLAWRPLSVVLHLRTLTSTRQVQRNGRSTTNASSEAWGEEAQTEKSVVMVGHTEIPIIADVKLRNPMVSVLPTATIGLLAEAVAAQISLSPADALPSSSTLKSMQQSPPTRPRDTSRGFRSLSESDSPIFGARPKYITEQNRFEERLRDTPATTATTSSARLPISADRILFFLNDTPLFSPMTTLLDALTAFAVSGASLRDLVAVQRCSSESVDVQNAKITAALPTLPFWTLTHALEFVVLAEPLPASVMLNLMASPSASSAGSCCCCGCDGLRPAFLCSPKHLFDEAPSSGPLALYSVLSTMMREEVGGSLAVLQSNQRRLSSAVVHELYHQLNMYMLPPLLWCSSIGVTSRVGPGGCVANTAVLLSSGTFPLASYVLWRYPYIFSMEMRLSILKFFISAQRSLSTGEANRLLQNYRHLLVRRDRAEETRLPTSSAADDAHSILEIVGLQWMSREVVRRHRVTLTVQRRNILRCAEDLIRLANCNVTIDVAFDGEAGIGNGPAMEFYELIAEELLKPQHGLWRTEPIPIDELTDSPTLKSTHSPDRSISLSTRSSAAVRRRPCMPLFPAAKQTPTTLHYWKLLGVLLGRLLVIGTTTSLNFHPLLLRRLRGESLTSTAGEASRNMSQVDAALELTLHRLEMMDAGSLAACELFFTIPVSEADGYMPGEVQVLPLIPGGANRRVTVDNVQEYTRCLRTYYLHTVLDLALLHLRQGLQHTVNPLYLQLFNVGELGRLLGSPLDVKVWETREQFARNVEAAHGYHIKSDVVQYLLDIVPAWSAQMQHAFLKFVTGSSAVPYGGFTQHITVVRRDVDISVADLSVTPTTHSFGTSAAGLGATSSFTISSVSYDNSLPTVSTCFLYLKLPRYSSKAVLQDRLRFAVCEGQCFFSLT